MHLVWCCDRSDRSQISFLTPLTLWRTWLQSCASMSCTSAVYLLFVLKLFLALLLVRLSGLPAVAKWIVENERKHHDIIIVRRLPVCLLPKERDLEHCFSIATSLFMYIVSLRLKIPLSALGWRQYSDYLIENLMASISDSFLRLDPFLFNRHG